MTLQELVANNTGLLQSFSNWLKNVQAQVINRQQGLSAIEPGYRAIVKWVKDRLVQEVYTQIRANITAAAAGAAGGNASGQTLPAN